MKTINLRKWNRMIHRDLGYFFFGMTIIYALSGIALNHKVMRDWNPNIIEKQMGVSYNFNADISNINKQAIEKMLEKLDFSDNYRQHYFENQMLTVLLGEGSTKIVIDTETGNGIYTSKKRRQVFNQTSYLHYNPSRLWTWFSDFYAGGLFLLAISGLFIIRGKNGITGRGAWLTSIGIIIPIALIIYYLY